MTVLPGSLDYLYHNGILDHIPYEAYEMTPVANQQMNNLQSMISNTSNPYLNTAQQGNLYSTYNNPDTFVYRNNSYAPGQDYSFSKTAFGIGDGIGAQSQDFATEAFGENGKSFRESILGSAESQTDKDSKSFGIGKGLLAVGVVLATIACLFSGKKKPASANNKAQSFLSKLNPLNWLKK